MTQWQFSLLAALTSIACAREFPVSVVTHEATCHASIREAATAGILVAAGSSRRVEFGGGVLQRGAHCFVYSVPVTSHQPGRVEYIIRSEHGRMRLVGIYHTHIPGGHASEFSPHDREEQKRLGVPSYVGTIGARTGEVAIRALGEIAGGWSYASTAE